MHRLPRRTGTAAVVGLLLYVAAAPAAAQAPAEHTLAVAHGADTLAATVILPRGRGPFPAVVLVHGSDSATRETGPYRRHAEFLARHGVAGVIYDKRGAGRSTGVYRESEDFTLLADDALAVHAAARMLPGIDSARVGMWGRSQGGWVVPLAAARGSGVAFAVLEVGGGVTVREQNVYARQQQLRARGLDAAAVAEATEVWIGIWDYMRTARGGGRADSLLRRVRTRDWFSVAAPTMAGVSRSGTLADSAWLANNATSPQSHGSAAIHSIRCRSSCDSTRRCSASSPATTPPRRPPARSSGSRMRSDGPARRPRSWSSSRARITACACGSRPASGAGGRTGISR